MSVWEVGFWIVAIVGSIGTAGLLTGVGVLLWLARRAAAKRRSVSKDDSLARPAA
jgi:hypothetical protein